MEKSHPSGLPSSKYFFPPAKYYRSLVWNGVETKKTEALSWSAHKVVIKYQMCQNKQFHCQLTAL